MLLILAFWDYWANALIDFTYVVLSWQSIKDFFNTSLNLSYSHHEATFAYSDDFDFFILNFFIDSEALSHFTITSTQFPLWIYA
jgi:hypothetical protein